MSNIVVNKPVADHAYQVEGNASHPVGTAKIRAEALYGVLDAGNGEGGFCQFR